MPSSVGIVVPAYRPDVDLLSRYVSRLAARFEEADIRIELDAPGAGVDDALAGLPATVATVPGRRGKGAAITAGFEALDTDVLLFVDADGSTPVEAVADVLAPVLDDTADLAVGSRRHPDAEVRSHQTFARRRLGDVFAWVARSLLEVDLYDYQCGAKALTRATWMAVRDHLYEPGFAWDLEVVTMAAALDCRVVEVPIVWEDRPGSTVSPIRSSLSLGRALLVAHHRAKRVQNSRLHGAIGARWNDPPALIDRPPEPTREKTRGRGR